MYPVIQNRRLTFTCINPNTSSMWKNAAPEVMLFAVSVRSNEIDDLSYSWSVTDEISKDL